MNSIQEALKNVAHEVPRARGQERTQDDPQRTKEAKPPELTSDVKRVLKAYEFFKGNQFISFDPESFQWFDALEASFGRNTNDNQDLNLYQFATNFYQMLGSAFVAALSAQLPKTRFLPENAEREEDIGTA